VRQKTSAAKAEKKTTARLSVSISEALRSLAAHGAAVRRREALRGRVIGHAVGMLLAKDTPVEQWRVRAPPLRACRVREAREVCARAELCLPAARASTRAKLALGRVALALASSDEETREAEAIARAALRDTIVAPFVRASAPLFGRRSRSGVGADVAPRPETSDEKTGPTKTNVHAPYAVCAEYPARLNLAGGWTDTPPYCLERGGAVLHVAVLTEESERPGSSSGGGRLRRPIAATVSVRSDLSARGVVRLVTDAARGAEAQTETVASTRELLKHDDPTHAFALLEPRCVSRCALSVCRFWKRIRERTEKRERKKDVPLPDLAAALEAFTGVKNAGSRGARARGPASRLGARHELRARARAAARAARGRDARTLGAGGAQTGREVGGQNERAPVRQRRS
jgi:fucokinase